MNYCSDISGGIVTLKTIVLFASTMKPIGNNRNLYQYPIYLNIYDANRLAPGKKNSLYDLSKTLKYNIPKKPKYNNDDENSIDIPCFFDYASYFSSLPLLYVASLFGINNKPQVSIASAASKSFHISAQELLSCETEKEFDRKYRGIKKKRKFETVSYDSLNFLRDSYYVPISSNAKKALSFAEKSYKGGYNICSQVGFFQNETYDYDLQNAYITALSMVPCVDWEKPIKARLPKRNLKLQDFFENGKENFDNIVLSFAFIEFEFPKNVKFPTIPVKVDDAILYFRSNKGSPCYANGTEIVLALKLGAKVKCHEGYILNPLSDEKTGNPVYLNSIFKTLAKERKEATIKYGDNCLEELIIKEFAVSVYGKISQGIVPKSAYSAFDGKSYHQKSCVITNPVLASAATSIIRTALLAAQNECEAKKGQTYTGTTDGLVANLREEEFNKLELYGLAEKLRETRRFLTDGADERIWKKKHTQTDLLNFNTRGNVSLSLKGVCAHGNFVTGHKKDGKKDRLSLFETVLSRTGRVQSKERIGTQFKDVLEKDYYQRRDNNYTKEKTISLDYDLKRKPILESMTDKEIIINDKNYLMAVFDTEPYENVAEYQKFKSVQKNSKCLRTKKDWEIFFFKVNNSAIGCRIEDIDRFIIMSCLKAFRAGLFGIPLLKDKSPKEVIAYFNCHNDSDKLLNMDDWKNAGKKSRQQNNIEIPMIKKKMKELINDSPKKNRSDS